jgi:nickel transport protein
MKNRSLSLVKRASGRYIIGCIIMFLSCNSGALAHVINFETSVTPPVVVVNAYFTATSPVGEALVEIFAPGNERPYQTGRTDQSGNFAFLPDRPGEWSLSIDDERGHIDMVIVTVTDSFFVAAPAAEFSKVSPEKGLSNLYRALFGLTLIFGLTGIIYGLKAKQALKRKDQTS